MPPYIRHKDNFTITTDPTQFDLAVIHGYLTRSYWKRGVSLELVQRCVTHSLGFALLDGSQQVGFARVVTDYTDFAYLADVFVLETHRGQGLGVWLVETVLAHPALQTIRRFSLATRDAQELYRKFGFQEVPDSNRRMERDFTPPWFIPD